MVEFFLRRPILASACSLIVLLLGLGSLPGLPIAQYPKIAPPTVTVTAAYTGASAETVESSITAPLEQAVNGVQGLRYLSSRSASDGTSTITCVFELGEDVDRAAADVQNAVNLTQGQLPAQVTQLGVAVAKNSGAPLMVFSVTSRDPRWDRAYLSNYLANTVDGDLQRIPGVAGVQIFGERKYAMRLWLDPKKLMQNGLAAADVVAAVRAQNVQVGAGAIGAPPTTGDQPYEYALRAAGRLHTASDFADVILARHPDGGYVRLRDVARVTLGSETYADSLTFNGQPAVGVGVQQLQSGNALAISRQAREVFARLQPRFPAGVEYHVAFDRTQFLRESLREVVLALLGAIALVVLVIFLFLQDWRSTLIPAITIPVSLIGTFFLMRVLGFSINTLTLFGLTLATGLVVDDAIVVIENVARFIQHEQLPPLRATREAMREITGALVASSVCLLAVFVPVAFFPGTTGLLYKQFALTVACSIAISLFNALTLTPVLSAMLFRNAPARRRFFGPVNAALAATLRAYEAALPRLLRHRRRAAAVFAGALALTGWAYAKTPTGFIPEEDLGFVIVAVQGPSYFSLDQTRRVQEVVEGILREQPEVVSLFDDGGYGFSGNSSNDATMYVQLRPWSERSGAEHAASAVLRRVNRRLARLSYADVVALNPSSIPGLGAQGGFAFQLEDRADGGLSGLQGAANRIIAKANAPRSGLAAVYTGFSADKPTLAMDVDREKAINLGVGVDSLFNTLQVYLGSLYVNDFDMLGRKYRVYAQADAPYRSRVSDLGSLYVSAAPGTGPAAQIPLSTLVKVRRVEDPQVITHFNLYRSVEIDGNTAAGYGSGQSIATMEQLAGELAPGYDHEWSGLAREQVESGSQSLVIFAAGLVFVFVVLAAQYESLASPLVILLAVPLALLGALGGLWLRHIAADVFAQVGYVMLIGLAAKNAILIVEFANQLRRGGLTAADAVRAAARTRFRPIVMTSLAFVLGVVPLVFAAGPGSGARHSLGTVVFCGMLVSTVLNLFLIPALYALAGDLGLLRKFAPD